MPATHTGPRWCFWYSIKHSKVIPVSVLLFPAFSPTLHEAKIINSAQFQQHSDCGKQAWWCTGAESGPVPNMRCLVIKLTSVYAVGIHNKTPKLQCLGSQARIWLHISPLPAESPADGTCSWLSVMEGSNTDALWHFWCTQMGYQMLALLKSCWYPLLLRESLIRSL